MKTLIHSLLLLLTSLLLSAKELPSTQPFFSKQFIQDAWGKPELLKTGVFFYFTDQGEGIAGPLLEIYFVDKGFVTKTVRGGSIDSKTLLTEIKGVGIESFNFQSEIRAITTQLVDEAKAEGKTYTKPFEVLDGGVYKYTFNLDGKSFTLEAMNPSPDIEYYSSFSPKIKKLKEVLDILCLYYGRHSLGL